MCKLDYADTATAKVAQAKALATMLYGEAGEAFRNLNDSLQDEIQWLLADTLEDAQKALSHYFDCELDEQQKAHAANVG